MTRAARSLSATRDEGFDEKALQDVLIKTRPNATKAQAAWYAALIMAVAREVEHRPSVKPKFMVSKEFTKALKSALDVAISAQPDEARVSQERAPEMFNGRIVEVSRGAGLGRLLTPAEAKAQMAKIVTHPPVESWAGPLLGAVQIEKQFRIPRSTLALWHSTNAVIGIQRGVRRHEYPVEQFIDGRPVAGIAKLVEVTPSPRSAWMWLRQPHGAFDGATPLSMLKMGKPEDVIKIAHRDFDAA